MASYKPKLSDEQIKEILRLRHEEDLENWKIAQIMKISERDVAYVIGRHW